MNNADPPALDANAAAAAAAVDVAAVPPGAAGAVAPLPGVGGGAGDASWENLMNDAGHLPHEVGAALWLSHKSATDQQVVAPLLTLGERAVDADLLTQLRQWVDDPDVKYYLVVIGKRIEVLHQLRACHATAGNGQRILGLLGERTLVQGVLVPPKLHSLRGAINNQALAIGLEDVAAPTMDDIGVLFAGDATLELVPALQVADDAAPPVLSAWKLVEIHPKVASLFLKGKTVREAFLLTRRIAETIQPIYRPALRVLEDFIRGAVTSTAGADPVSTLTTGWSRIDPGQTELLEAWFCKVLGKVPMVTTAPPPPAAALPPLALPPPVAAGNTELLVAALTNYAQARENPVGKAYLGFELPTLLAICGNDPPFAVLTEAYLSPFLLQMKPHRKSAANCRAFYKSYRDVQHPDDRAKYTWVASSSFIKDIMNLTFHGSDPFIEYGKRHLGVGPFSMSPSSPGNDDSTRLAQFAAFKETQSMHTPENRAQMAALSTKCAPIPRDANSMHRVVDHLENQVAILFTTTCPLVPYLHQLAMLLREGSHFVNSTGNDFIKFMWTLHTSCREFFKNQSTFIIQRMVVDITSRVKLNPTLPVELEPEQNIRDTSRPAMNPSEALIPGMSNKRPKNTDRTATGSSFAGRFRPHLNIAAGKTHPQPFMAGQLCKDAQQIRALFGEEFRKLLTNSKEPCIKYFIFGSCQAGNSCKFCHSLKSEPTPFILKGIENRVKARVEEIYPNAQGGPTF
jgi:hypothetical protein